MTSFDTCKKGEDRREGGRERGRGEGVKEGGRERRWEWRSDERRNEEKADEKERVECENMISGGKLLIKGSERKKEEGWNGWKK